MFADIVLHLEGGNCAVMNALVASILLKMAIAFRVIAPIIGLLCMAFVLRNSQLHRRLHGNAKLLCILHYIWTIGLCIAYIINYGFNLIQLSMSFSNPCEYLIPTSLSFNLAATVMIFILLQMTSMIALAIERTVATIRYEKYENEKNIILLILLIILQFAVSFLIPYVYLIPSTNWEQPAVGPSLVTDDNLEKNQIFTIAFIVSELVVTIYIYALRYLNYYRRKAVRKWNSQSGLSTRYQLDENIRALNLIVPLIWLQFIFNFTTAVMVYIIVAVESDLDAVTYSIYDRLNGVLTLYPIALLILLFFKDPLMMTYFRKNFPPMRELSKVNPSLAVTVASNVYVKNTSTPQFVIAENTNARFHQLKALFEANTKYGQ